MKQKQRFRVGKTSYRKDFPSELHSDTTMLISITAPPGKRHVYRLLLIDFDRLTTEHYGYAEMTVDGKTIPYTVDQIAGQLGHLYTLEEAKEGINWLLDNGILQRDKDGVIWHPAKSYGIPVQAEGDDEDGESAAEGD